YCQCYLVTRLLDTWTRDWLWCWWSSGTLGAVGLDEQVVRHSYLVYHRREQLCAHAPWNAVRVEQLVARCVLRDIHPDGGHGGALGWKMLDEYGDFTVGDLSPVEV